MLAELADLGHGCDASRCDLLWGVATYHQPGVSPWELAGDPIVSRTPQTRALCHTVVHLYSEFFIGDYFLLRSLQLFLFDPGLMENDLCSMGHE